jgi:hypothetical protein
MKLNDDKKIVGTARVRLTVEVTAGRWGKDCTLHQLFDQAGREAKRLVEENMCRLPSFVRMVGQPEVIGIVAEDANAGDVEPAKTPETPSAGSPSQS